MSDHNLVRLNRSVVLTCCLRLADGDRAPESANRAWFFDLPIGRDTPEAWAELIPRIFYDHNVAFRRREPHEDVWVDCEAFGIANLEPGILMEWADDSMPPFPWIDQDRSKLWEPSVCYFVDDEGRYDDLSAHSFTELLLHRLLHAGKIGADDFVQFIDRYSGKRGSGEGRRIFADAQRRYLSLVTVRGNTSVYRMPPGIVPPICGPVRPEDL